jgi:hypothetical protein
MLDSFLDVFIEVTNECSPEPIYAVIACLLQMMEVKFISEAVVYQTLKILV